MIWSSTSTLALSIDTLQRNATQITDKTLYYKLVSDLQKVGGFLWVLRSASLR